MNKNLLEILNLKKTFNHLDGSITLFDTSKSKPERANIPISFL